MPARTVGRIRTRAAFRQLQHSGSRGSSGPVRATFIPVDPSAPGVFPQVGYAIGKRCGNAVIRNTLRRRMREASKMAAPSLPRGIYLLRAEPAATTHSATQLSSDVSRALRRASGQTVAP
jgi:ribonuclease P protein component